MRVTEKDTQHFSYNLDTNISSDDTNGYDVRGGNHVSEVIAKLGQLEDIEEELGISLVTLINILKNGFYCYCAGTCLDYVQAEDVEIDFENKRFNYFSYFKSYGRSWALTKEELVGNDGLL